ncbi:MAG: DUF2804 domain-containing protein [Desulfatibacillaceae bacterium]
MYRIVGKNNRINYGVVDEPVDFNIQDFKVLDFFGKEFGPLRRRLPLHAFNFIGIMSPQFIIGLAAVDLTYMHVVFAYLYHFTDGLLFDYQTKGPLTRGLRFPKNPDEYDIFYKKRGTRLHIGKSHMRHHLEIEAAFSERFFVGIEAEYGLSTHNPLRVVNPSEPYRWTFTEKCAPIVPRTIEVFLEKDAVRFDRERTTLLYDWSGGFLRRETNWYWSALSGILDDGTPVGANFAALTNETFFSENAYWIGHQRHRVPRCVFDFDPADLYAPWRIWDENGLVDLTFTPGGERREKINALVLKSNFRQFYGSYDGTLTAADGTKKALEKVHGLAEFHRAVW